MQLNFVSYAFNLNLGWLVGGIAFRYRLYSRLGLAMGTITHIPGNPGVLEAVFVALLSHRMPEYELLAGLNRLPGRCMSWCRCWWRRWFTW